MKNPHNKELPAKFYAKAQASGECGFNELAEDIAYATSLTDGDVLNVLRALVVQVRKHIQRGEIIRLENFGSFQVQLSSRGAATEDTFTQNQIRKARLQFRPGIGLQSALQVNALSFRSVPTRKAGKADKDPSTGGGDSGLQL